VNIEDTDLQELLQLNPIAAAQLETVRMRRLLLESEQRLAVKLLEWEKHECACECGES